MASTRSGLQRPPSLWRAVSESWSSVLSSAGYGYTAPHPDAATNTLEQALQHESSARRYENFSTIDWMHHATRKRARLAALARSSAPRRGLAFLAEAGETWGAVTATGILVGLAAGGLDMALEWLSDLKFGMCATSFFHSRQKCCAGNLDTEGTCADWHEWSYRITPLRTFPLVNFFAYVFLATAYAGVSALLVDLAAPEYAPLDGIPQLKTILGGFIMDSALSLRTFCTKFVALIFSVSSGLSIGNKGPLVHIAACVGNLVSRLSPSHRHDAASSTHLLSCATAAGIAVAFGSPLGGIIFALEETSTFFTPHVMWMSFLCCVAATLTLEIVNPYNTGSMILFKVQSSHVWQVFEFFSFGLIGVLGGALGAFFNRWNIRLQIARKRSQFCLNHQIREAMILAFISAVLCYFSSLSRDKMLSLLAGLFKECDENDYHGICSGKLVFFTCIALLYTMVLRFGLIVISYGVRVPSGIYIPCMVVGACLGRFVGILISGFQSYNSHWAIFASCPADGKPCIGPGSYALLGSAAVLAGATRLSICIVLILFELTGSMDFILPTIVTVVVAKFVADFIAGRDGHANLMIQMNHYPFLENRSEFHLRMTAQQLIANRPAVAAGRRLVMLKNGMQVSQIREVLAGCSFSTFPVVDDFTLRSLEGCITRTDLQYGIAMTPRETAQRVYFVPPFPAASDNRAGGAEAESHAAVLDLGALTDQTPLAVHPMANMDGVYQLFLRLGLRYVFVKNKGRLVGVLTKKDVIRCVNAEQGTFATMDQEHERALDLDPVIARGGMQSSRWIRCVVGSIRRRMNRGEVLGASTDRNRAHNSSTHGLESPAPIGERLPRVSW